MDPGTIPGINEPARASTPPPEDPAHEAVAKHGVAAQVNYLPQEDNMAGKTFKRALNPRILDEDASSCSSFNSESDFDDDDDDELCKLIAPPTAQNAADDALEKNSASNDDGVEGNRDIQNDEDDDMRPHLEPINEDELANGPVESAAPELGPTHGAECEPQGPSVPAIDAKANVPLADESDHDSNEQPSTSGQGDKKAPKKGRESGDDENENDDEGAGKNKKKKMVGIIV
ncbi:unnamed protein product [Caenorhabditis bovis]|uniref:Uncharacterized protein n=1 Tax=Caenorhabditis bovis TaxID=2654633 RepID=A0A8S1FEV6_9PELO|nr:unnamed protein product [Caenorhabditis bovis]